jgi:prepilin-type N-terminal cleavage/methylation domain-containing protein
MTKIRRNRGFTIIEIMVVIAIMAIVMAVGIPSMYRALQRDDLARAVNDTVEGCKMARDRAILQGIPYEFVVKGASELNVAPASQKKVMEENQDSSQPETTDSSDHGTSPSNSESPASGFPRKLAEEVEIQLLDVNFHDHMRGGTAEDARVKFFPNGTSDEFTIVYNFKGKQRTIQLDIVTGLATEIKRE